MLSSTNMGTGTVHEKKTTFSIYIKYMYCKNNVIFLPQRTVFDRYSYVTNFNGSNMSNKNFKHLLLLKLYIVCFAEAK